MAVLSVKRGKFDSNAYKELHPAVASLACDPLTHYVKRGHLEWRRIAVRDSDGLLHEGTWLDKGYFDLHPDVRADSEYGTRRGFDHFRDHGHKEDRTIAIVKTSCWVYTRAFFEDGYLSPFIGH